MRRGFANLGKLISTVGVLLGLNIPALVSGEDALQEFHEARRWYVQAAGGDSAALAEATRWFALRAEQGHPNPRVWAYLGSCRLLEAAAVANPLRKLELCREGGAWLERALAAAAEDVEVRLVRGLSLIHLPAFFNKRATALADLTWAVERVNASEDAPVELVAAAWWQIGLVRERQRDLAGARAAWEQAARWAPHSRSGQQAAARLNASGRF